MRVLDLSAGAALLLLAGVAAVVVLLYLLKPSPRRLTVASALIWEQVLRARRRRPERMRWWLSLLLALAIALSVTAALVRPQVTAMSGVARDVVLVVDTYPTMGVREADGRTRLDAALERAARIIGEQGAGSRYLIADTMRQIGIAAFESHDAALARLRSLRPATAGSPWFPDVQFPQADAKSDAPGRHQLWFLTDGIAPVSVPPSARTVSVFEAADNVGIEAFEVRALPADARRHQAYLEVANASPGRKKVVLRITGIGAPAIERTLDVAGGASASVVADVSAFGEGPLRASVRTGGDALPLDDVAYAYLPGKGRVRVALVTNGNADLARTLRLLPRLEVEVIPPAALREVAGFDALVLDRVASNEPPAVPALLVGPPSVPWLARDHSVLTDTRLARWDGSHPLLSGVSLRDVLVDRATVLKPAAGERGATLTSVAQAPGGQPLILASHQGRRFALISFALDTSNFSLQASFPAFLSNTIDWLTREPRAAVRSVGQVTIPVVQARVLDLDGREVATRAAPGATLFEADEPGLYTAVTRDERMRVVVNRFDPRITAVNGGRFAQRAPPAAPPQAAPPLAIDPWILLLVLSTLLLVVEWWTYNRRVTV